MFSSTRAQVITGIVVIAIALIGWNASKNAPVVVEIVKADRGVTLASVGDLSLHTSPLPLLGTVTSLSEANIKAESSGKLVGVYKKLGDYVSAGEVIAEFENSGEHAAVLQSQGAYDAATAEIGRAHV